MPNSAGKELDCLEQGSMLPCSLFDVLCQPLETIGFLRYNYQVMADFSKHSAFKKLKTLLDNTPDQFSTGYISISSVPIEYIDNITDSFTEFS